MSAPTQLPFRIVDVFTASAFAGNQLAVVFDADALSAEQMQAIAREFNFSETTFVLAPTTDEATYRLRIFTPSVELPFAGHPSIGTAWAMKVTGRLPSGSMRLVQECGAGLLPLSFESLDGADVVRLVGGSPSVSDPIAALPLLLAVGLSSDDLIDGEACPPRRCGGGIDFAFLRVTEDAVTRCRPDASAVASIGGAGLSVFSWDRSRLGAHVRVFAGGAGVAEDPATGSAAIGLGIWLASAGLVDPDGSTAFTISQGSEIGRPSILYAAVEAKDGTATSASVAGSVVGIAEGMLTVPV